MANYSYTARSEKGDIQKGMITARSKEAAIASLREHHLQPLIVDTQSKVHLSMNLKMPGQSGVKTKDLVIFTRQFSTMINAGVPLLRCLNTLKEQSDSPALQKILDQVSNEVQGGSTLSAALAKHPKVFTDVYVNMVQAGETGGILDQILSRLATQVEKDSRIKSKLKGAMIYPAVICVVAFGAVFFLMTSIVPKMLSILTANGGKLPFQTKLVLAISHFLIHDWIVMFLIIIAVVVGYKVLTHNPTGKLAFHKVELKLPIFGQIILKVNVARFARTFSSLMGAGVSVMESLRVTAASLNNLVVRKALEDAIVDIKNGHSIADSLSKSPVLPKIVVQMAAVGEETGQMDTVLTKVAEFYEEEVDTIVNSLSAVIEPVLIVFLGGVVALIATSVIGPLTALESSVGGQS